MVRKKSRCLVVDDQRGTRMTLAGIIEDQGFEVAQAEDGYEAIRAVTDGAYDLVFMDIKMPGINGVQSFREIKKISPESVVVMMTGFAVNDLIEEAMEEGAYSVLFKPIDPATVIALIDTALNPEPKNGEVDPYQLGRLGNRNGRYGFEMSERAE